MLSSTFSVVLSLFPTIAVLLPSFSSAEATTAGPAALNTSQSYYLYTESTSNNTLYSCLYTQSYHTGAGLNDVVFVPGPVPIPDNNDAVVGFLNTTGEDGGTGYQEFDLGNEFPWGLYTNIYEPYAAWNPVQLNAGLGSGEFYLDETTGLVWNTTAFGGWLVCKWWHGLPQLFWYEPYYNVDIPDSCNFVYLKPEFF